MVALPPMWITRVHSSTALWIDCVVVIHRQRGGMGVSLRICGESPSVPISHPRQNTHTGNKVNILLGIIPTLATWLLLTLMRIIRIQID